MFQYLSSLSSQITSFIVETSMTIFSMNLKSGTNGFCLAAQNIALDLQKQYKEQLICLNIWYQIRQHFEGKKIISIFFYLLTVPILFYVQSVDRICMQHIAKDIMV